MTFPNPQPAPADAQLNRARLALRSGGLGSAAPLYEAYLRTHPESAPAHHEFGQILARMGRYKESATHVRRASELDPGNVEYLAHLAGQLMLARDFHGAAEVYEELRRRTPDSPDPHASAAWLYEILGEYEKATAAALRALEISPHHGRALVTRIKVELRQTTPDEAALRAWLGELDRVATTDNLDVRGLVLELMGDINEQLGEYARAFQIFARVNETDRTAHRRMLPGPQAREGYLKSLEAIGSAITPELAQRWAERRPDDGVPVPAFLVGFPRSGTTMTERALGAHPAIRSIDERPTFETCKGLVPKMVGGHVFRTRPLGEVFDVLSVKQVASLRSAYWEQVWHEIGPVPDDELVLDKNPLRVADLPFVNRVFPESRVIVALRDPRDVCLSCYRQRFDFGSSPAMSFFLDLRATAHLYAEVMGRWLRTRESYTFPWKEVRYEDTVADFESRIRDVVGFLGVGWDDAVLSFHETSGRTPSRTPSYHAIRKKVYTSAIGRWRRYADQLAPILPALQKYVDAFGYADDATAPHAGPP